MAVKATAVLPDGSVGSEQRLVTHDGDGRMSTKVIEQQVNGQLLPGSEKVTLVRQTKASDRPILDRPIMPNLGEKILRDEIRNEIVARRVERAVRVRDRIRELYYRENHPFVYWWHYMWTRHPIWSWWRVTAPYRWANWSSVTSWCGYGGSYTEPVTYDYTDQGVYANGKEVATLRVSRQSR